jgi:plastocyanin
MNTSARLRASGYRKGLSPSTGAVVLGLLMLGAPIAGVMGCGGRSQETPPPAATEPATSGATDAMVGGSGSITLTWDPQNNCVEFSPRTTNIDVGDQVTFNTSMDTTVTVHVPGGLFSAADTTINVTRGAGQASPVARAIGTYLLSSSPVACASTAGGGGPSIVVDTGEAKPKP